MDYYERKAERCKRYAEQHGKKLVTCTGCNGSGYYDNHGSPKCGSCNGTGKVRETSYEAPKPRKIVSDARKGAVGVVEIDADVWAASGGTKGFYGRFWRAGRLRIVEFEV